MGHIDFIEKIHKSTKRDYLKRVTDYPKAEASKVAKQFGYDFWDGDRKFGYGGHHYDGRWKSVAADLAHAYNLKSGSKVLDIGCGKGYLLYDLIQCVPGLVIEGLDISQYALDHAQEEVKPFLRLGHARELPYADHSFVLVLSINTLHNLPCYDLEKGLKEVVRVSKGKSYIVVDSFRNEEERINLFYWHLTCACFYSIEEWHWWFNHCGYQGDYSFVYFE